MGYFIQKAIELDEVNRKKVPLETLEDYTLMAKYDGCHGLVTFYGADLVQCRTGSGDPWLSIHDGILNPLFDRWVELGRPGPYFTFAGEAWMPGTDHATINGTFRRQSKQFDLRLVQFDTIQHSIKDVLADKQSFCDRWLRRAAHQGSVYEACEWPATVIDSAHATARGLKSSHSAYDGCVLVHKYKPYKPGRCRDGEKIKVKPAIEFDLRVSRFNPANGEKTGKITGSITVDFEGKELDVAVLREDDLAELHANNNAWTGRIVAVEAMTRSSKGLLREPRLKGLRIDKHEADA
jgi:hypothetical protein